MSEGSPSLWRRTLPLLAVTTVLACFHTHHVGDEQRQGSGADGGEEGQRKEEQGASGKATRTRVPPRAGRPAVAASPEGLMNPGSTRKIQDALRQQGFFDGEPSGTLDEATSAGLRKFQSSQGLAQTGAPDRETLRRLGVDPQEVYRTVPPGSEASPSR